LARRRQQRDLIGQMGLSSLAPSLFSPDATTLDPMTRILFSDASRAIGFLSTLFTDRRIIVRGT